MPTEVKFQESSLRSGGIESPRKKSLVKQTGNKSPVSLTVTPKKMSDRRSLLDDDPSEGLSKTAQPVDPVPPVQPSSHPPFQPGSTSQDAWGNFVLVCNHIGFIVSFKSSDSRPDSRQRSCNVRFWNTSKGGNVNISGPDEFEFGALSNVGVALASKTVLIYRPRKPSSEPWTRTLPDGETALAVAVGSDWVAVATR